MPFDARKGKSKLTGCDSNRAMTIKIVEPELHVKIITWMQNACIGLNEPTSRLHVRQIVIQNVIYY